jgi:hypothetical protein
MKNIYSLLLFFTAFLFQTNLYGQVEIKIETDIKYDSLGRKIVLPRKVDNLLGHLDSLNKYRASVAEVNTTLGQVTDPNILDSKFNELNKLSIDSLGKVSVPKMPGPEPLQLGDKDKVNALPAINTKLPNGDPLGALPEVPTYIIKTSSLGILDSIRNAYLDADKLKLKETKVSEEFKKVDFKERKAFIRSLHFNGVLGADHNFKNLLVSPAIASRISNPFAAGLGINLKGTTANVAKKFEIGLRMYTSYELLKKKLNIQLENNSYPERINTSSEPLTNKFKINHQLMVGAGYMIKYSNVTYISISTLYQVNYKYIPSNLSSPLVIRIGISKFNSK